MTDVQPSLLQKKKDLSFYYKMAKEAYKANDVDQALKISKNGLEQAKLQDQEDWIQKFDSFQSSIKSTKATSLNPSLNPSLIKEDIKIIKGIGSSVAEQLHNAGINSLNDLANSNPNRLSKIKGIGLTTANKYIQNARNYLESNTGTLDRFSKTYILKNDIESYEDHEDALVGSESEIESEQYEEIHESEILENKKSTVKISDNIEDNINQEINVRKPEIKSEILNQSNFELVERAKTSKLILNHSQIKDISKEILKELELSGFFIVKQSPDLRPILTGVDFLAIRLIHVHEFLDLIFIVPIKICTLTESLIVSDTAIGYHSTENIPEKDYHLEKLLQSYIKALSNCGQLIYEDIRNEGELFRFCTKYLHLNISLEKTFTHKNLFFRSGPLQYKILVEPLLVSQNKVGFTEKLIPFAYQKSSNTHIVEVSRLSDLLQYLDHKYFIIETYSKQKSSITIYCEASNKFLEDLRKYSTPFMIYGFISLFILLFQEFSILSLFINLGYAVIGFYVMVVVYIYIKFYKQKVDLRKKFSTPYFQKKFDFDDTDLILIREQLSKPLLTQFFYEILGKNINSKIVRELEQYNAENYLKMKEKERENRSKNSISKLFEPETVPTKYSGSKPKNKLVEKYSSFLED
ncbi:MAG: helix-hairpin-helix domain-containing protein [Candidatus Hodarchaeota archaeon]